jgi:hypothetical protein
VELTLEARPTVAGTPLDLDPTLRPGESAYFAGEWLAYDYDGGEQRYESAYAGRLIGDWNGWAVWECTRDVAVAVVADQEAARRHTRALLEARGMSGAKLELYLDSDVCPMEWDGDVIVVDRTALDGGIMRIEPNERGLYVVMGGHWCWEEIPVDLADMVYGDVRP